MTEEGTLAPERRTIVPHRSAISKNVKLNSAFATTSDLVEVFPNATYEQVRSWAERELYGAIKGANGHWYFRRDAVNDHFGFDVFTKLDAQRAAEKKAAAAAAKKTPKKKRSKKKKRTAKKKRVSKKRASQRTGGHQ